jgi:mono/diheme cytochrome c family protein
VAKNRLYRSVSLVAALVLVAPALARAGADEAKALYDKQCQSCHSIKGQGGKMAALGGPLDGVGAKRDAAWLKDYLKDPKSKMPNAKMPKMTLSDQQLDDLVAYMMTLK